MKVNRCTIVALFIAICLCCGLRVDASLLNGGRQFDQIVQTDSYNCSITQDSDGFIWIGCSEGLVKFDGYEKIHYKARNAGSTVSSNYISDVYEDSEGLLWIGTLGSGACLYDKKTDLFRHFRYKEGDSGSICSDSLPWSPNLFSEDKGGNVWISTTNGLNVYNRKNGTLSRFKKEDGLTDNYIWTVYADVKNKVWIGTNDGGLNIYDRTTGTFSSFQHDPNDPNSIGAGPIYRILESRDGSIWIGTGKGGLNKFDQVNQCFVRYTHDPSNPKSISNNCVYNIYEDREGKLWTCGTYFEARGLEIFDPKSEEFVKHTTTSISTGVVSSNLIMDFFEDNVGDIWIVDNSGKIIRFSNQRREMGIFVSNEDLNSIGFNTPVSSYEDSRGTVWFGYPGGFDSYDRNTNRFVNYKMIQGDLSSIQGPYVFSIVEDRSKRLWLGSSDGALNIFNRDTGKVEKRFVNKDSITVPRGLIEDANKDGVFWYGTEGLGLTKFDSHTGLFTNYRNRPGDKTSLSSNVLNVINQGKDGVLWLGTAGGGISRHVPDSGLFESFTKIDGDPSSIPGNVVNDMFTDSNGTCWVTTQEGGLCTFDKTALKFTRVKEGAGFITSSLRSILEHNGYLWISSDSGIFKFDPYRKVVVNRLSAADGLQGDIFSIFRASSLRTKDGILWFVGHNGVSYFNPDSIKENTYVPPVWLTQIKQGNKPIKLNSALERVREINLDWRSNFFEFEMAALNYTNSKNNQYRYMLEGVDRDWFNSGTRRFGKYTGLPSGNFKLRVIASNNDNVWNTEGITIPVNVKPPFWETKAFVAVVIAIIALFIALVVLYIIKLNIEIKGRKEAVKALKDREEHLAVTLHSIGDAVIVTDLDHIITRMNSVAEKVTGWKQDEAIGQKLDEVYVTEQIPLKLKLDSELEEGREELVKLRLTTKDGEHLIVSDRSAPIKDAKDETIGNVLIFRDITKQSQLEKRLLQSQKMESIGKLAGGVAHDFNNMLAGIMGASELIICDKTLSDTSKDYLAMILKAARRAAELTSKLLAFSRKGKFVSSNFNLNDIIDDAVSLLRRSLDKKVEINVNFLADNSIIAGDAAQLQNCFINLGVNAKDAMNENGTISIATRNVSYSYLEDLKSKYTLENCDYIEVKFSDTGSGIPEDKIEKIFEPFFTTKEIGKGTGLGLAAVYGTVCVHSGALKVTSEPGRGTSFYIYLPICEGGSLDHDSDLSEIKRGTGTVLLVDDEEVIRETSMRTLKDLGYDVLVAANGLEAIEMYMVNREQIDLVITDVVMPKMDGVELAEKILDVDPDTIIIVASGHASKSKKASLEKLKLPLIRKPFRKSQLSVLIHKVLNQK